jgi:hypothetical protein
MTNLENKLTNIANSWKIRGFKIQKLYIHLI